MWSSVCKHVYWLFIFFKREKFPRRVHIKHSFKFLNFSIALGIQVSSQSSDLPLMSITGQRILKTMHFSDTSFQQTKHRRASKKSPVWCSYAMCLQPHPPHTGLHSWWKNRLSFSHQHLILAPQVVLASPTVVGRITAPPVMPVLYPQSLRYITLHGARRLADWLN